MKLRLLNLTAFCLAILSTPLSLAHAEEGQRFHGEQPSKEHMETVRACAEKSGITLPRPEERRPGERPQLTTEQKQAMDQCFKESGIEPPAGPPPHRQPPHNEE